MRLFILTFFLCFMINVTYSQGNIDLAKRWDARWIAHPEATATEYGVYHFRRTFELDSVPDRFIVNISADNRYRLFINGVAIGIGPARGDLQHWRYEKYDIASRLRQGKNVIGVLVWNFAEHRPYAQFTDATGLIVQGEDKSTAFLNTDEKWKVIRNLAYQPETQSARRLRSFTVVGPGEIVDGSKYPWHWEQPEYDDSNWLSAVPGSVGYPYGTGTDAHKMLVPRTIPFMESSLVRVREIRRSTIDIPFGLFQGKADLLIPSNSKVSILIDNGVLTTAYPELIVSGGEYAAIKVTYSEALFDENGQKGNRNDIEGKSILGYEDFFYPDGGPVRTFRPLWFRTYRYIQLDIITKENPLVLHDLYGEFTGYPFEEKAKFESSDPHLKSVWETAWRTARLCAGETHYDCPYYEQLSYIGDTRIQCLLTLYVSGDDRLMRKSIDDFFNSSIPEGLTQSRYPSYVDQVIPPYSLFWVAMIHDYWMLRNDPDFISRYLRGMDNVLGWYESYLQDNGLLGDMPWWHFVDWADEWRWSQATRIGGVPNGANPVNSSILSLQYLYALDLAAELFADFGLNDKAEHYQALSKAIKEGVMNTCWDKEEGLIAESPSKDQYSQHANIFGILTDAIPAENQSDVLDKILNDEDLIQATFYFKFYLFRAIMKSGYGDIYLKQLEPWYDMIQNGLTTFAERPDPTRSDCHAWSASPMYDLLSIVAGINPGSPGFGSVKITPHPGELSTIKASLPHYDRFIEVELEFTESRTRGTVTLPKGVTGSFEYLEHEMELEEGVNQVNIRH